MMLLGQACELMSSFILRPGYHEFEKNNPHFDDLMGRICQAIKEIDTKVFTRRFIVLPEELEKMVREAEEICNREFLGLKNPVQMWFPHLSAQQIRWAKELVEMRF